MGPFQNTNDAFHTHECLDSTCLVPLCLSTRTKVLGDFLLLLQPFSAKLITINCFWGRARLGQARLPLFRGHEIFDDRV
ncbi:hypothetical protein EJ06DRAFT_525401, partial [Trichodelitschia bisporula]